MERCRALVKEFSDDIKMSFGLDKCAVIHIVKGEVNNLPEIQEIPILDEEESYKYLGIAESSAMKHDEAKGSAKKEFIKRVKGILKSGVNARYTTDAIRTYAMLILRYSFGILKWTAAELKGIDRKVRNILTTNGFHNPKSNLHCLYLSRDKGGRLIGAKDCHRQECSALAKHITSNTDPLSTIIRCTKHSKAHGLLSYLRKPKEATSKSVDEEHGENLLQIELHGNYFKNHNTIPTLNSQKSE